MWLFNLDRISELMAEETIQKAARTLLALPSKPVLKAVAVLWTVFLAMVFTLLFVVRLALAIPL